jgi:tetratricopeptide (TPR) repeat protein
MTKRNISGVRYRRAFREQVWRNRFAYSRRPIRAFVVGLAVFMGASITARAQDQTSTADKNTRLQGPYDAAQSFQAAGNLSQAALEYKKFLADALGALADHRAKAGDFTRATSLFDQALALDPADSSLKLEYAEACRAADELHKAKSLAQQAVNADPKNAPAHLVLGQILSQMDENDAGKQQLEIAVAIQPDFTNGYALAAAYLKLKDEDSAAKIFSEMLASFGDKPGIHLEFGSAYANAGYPEKAIPEFKKAIAENGALPGAHYALGAAYVLGLGVPAYAQAATEFEKELKISPNDYNSHLELGVIYLSQNKVPEAEKELIRATSLDPRNPDPFISLGQLYDQTGRLPEAEAAYRKAIALTGDVARNHYQVERAHYQLARVLLQTNRQDEAKKEMEISNQLLKLSVLAQQGGSGTAAEKEAASGVPASGTKHPEKLDPDALEHAEAIEKQIGPAIADSYNNLGAISAGNNDFTAALEYFHEAGEWNPVLEGLDYNWGRAAFSAHEYAQAIGPLSRYAQKHPQDIGARLTLGLSYFLVQNYPDALQEFRSAQPAQIDAVPAVAYAYAASLTKAGDYSDGVQRLKSMESDNPGVAEIHKALGEAYAAHRDCAQAIDELRTAIQLSPGDKDVERELNACEAARNGHSGAETAPKPN